MKNFTIFTAIFLCLTGMAYGQWTYTNLFEPKCQMGATSLGSKAYFGGGVSSGSWLDLVEIYDVESQTWSYGNLSFARAFPAAVSCGSKVFFAGGARFPYVYNYVDIYDTLSQQWSYAFLSQSRFSISAVSYGSKVLFAGGLNPATSQASDMVDIYDVLTGTWSTATLSMARGTMGAAVVGDRAFFAGGFNMQNFTDRVDIYNFTTNTWSTASLSQARGFVTAAVAGNKILFAGGMTNPNNPSSSTTLVDIYDTETNTWTTTQLSQARIMMSTAATAGNKAFFVGGGNFDPIGGYWVSSLNIIDIYDGARGQWSVDYLTHDVINHSVTAVGNYLLSAGGLSIVADSLYSTVEIYQVQSSSNIIHVPGEYLTIQAGINAATAGDTVLVADGLYYENINFMGKKPLVVASNFIMTGDTNHIANTIINGSQPVNPDIGSVVTFASGEDTTSVLCGFTITGGTGTVIPGVVRMGGGICLTESGGKFLNNHIEYNTSISTDWAIGGGIGAGAPVTTLPWVVIRNNRINHNEVECTANDRGEGGGVLCFYNLVMTDNVVSYNKATGGAGGLGGGAYLRGDMGTSWFNFSRNTLTHNEAIANSFNAMAALGGGFVIWQCHGIAAGNLFSFNVTESPAGIVAGGSGAFIELVHNNDLVFENNFILNNSFIGDECIGGGLCLYMTGGTYQNNVIQNNAGTHGGGIHIVNSPSDTAILINNTITGNNATGNGTGLYISSSNAVVINSILYNNTPSGTAIFAAASNLEVRYSDVESDAGVFPGEGNLNCEPVFEEDGYHLDLTCQLVNAGTSSVAINGVVYNCPPFDIDGEPRPYGNTNPEIGVDEVSFVDAVDEQMLSDNTDLWVLPNPARNFINVSLPMLSGIAQLTLFNITGEKLMEKQITRAETRVDISMLPKGIYFLRLQYENDVKALKIIKD